jgi:monofunctional glycosyltransferase
MPRVKKSRRPSRAGTLNRIARSVQLGVRWLLLGLATILVLLVVWVGAYRFVNPPGGIYMWQEWRRLGAIDQRWVPMRLIAPVMARSAVAAEDANFCLHWGFDVGAIRTAIEAGGTRGASTISQQVVKNVFLWHGRSWPRKVLEAGLTPVMELLWSKERILEVYLNVAEFDTGVFGVESAAQHYFGRAASDLTARQAALLAAILPAPQSRSASRPTERVARRARAIEDGAATIARDGRVACFGG